MSTQLAFQRLLTFFSKQSPKHGSSTISFLDSLRGDLSLGLNFPLALVLALTRHLVFRNAGGLFSLQIHVPSVKTSRKLLGGPGAFPSISEEKRYTRSELVNAVRRENASVVEQLDANGLWFLAAHRRDGKVSGKEVRMFQSGEIMESIAERRRNSREDVLPFWRGGPILYVYPTRALSILTDSCKLMSILLLP